MEDPESTPSATPESGSEPASPTGPAAESLHQPAPECDAPGDVLRVTPPIPPQIRLDADTPESRTALAGPLRRPMDSAASPVPSRRAALLATALAALALLAWLVVQRAGLLDSTGPQEIVRAQLDDLGRGQLRAAYDLFSLRYRQEVPFTEWRELVVTHWRVFRTRDLRFGYNEETGSRAVLETHLTAEGGGHYVARFTLVKLGGRWWVDDLRWSQEPEEHGRIST